MPGPHGRHSLRDVAPAASPKVPAGHGSHSPLDGSSENDPGGHTRHSAALDDPDRGLTVPNGHARHESFPRIPANSLYVPARHGSHISDSSSQYSPARHADGWSHSVDPGSEVCGVGHALQLAIEAAPTIALNVSRGHGRHEAESSDEYRPAAHGRHPEPSTSDVLPAPHCTHADDDVAPSSVLQVPAGHTLHRLAPPVEYEPCGHSMDVVPSIEE